MKQRLVRIIFSLLALALPIQTRAENSAIKIGITIPLSGELASVGEEIRRGLTMASDSYNARSPEAPVTLIFDDNGFQATRAVLAAQKFISQDQVNLMISLWDMTDSIAPLCERAKVPLIALRWDPEITAQFKYTFTFEATYRAYVKSQLQLLKELGAKTIAVITEQSKGWLLAQDETLSAAAQFGMQVLFHDAYVSSSSDFTTLLSKAVATKPDFIVFHAQFGNELLIKRLREIGPSQRFTGYYENIDHPELVGGIPFVALNSPAAWFQGAYRAKYTSDVKSRAAHAYDVFNLVAGIVQAHEGKLTADQFVNSLMNSQPTTGAVGSIRLNASKKTFEVEPVWRVYRGSSMEKFELPASKNSTLQ